MPSKKKPKAHSAHNPSPDGPALLHGPVLPQDPPRSEAVIAPNGDLRSQPFQGLTRRDQKKQEWLNRATKREEEQRLANSARLYGKLAGRASTPERSRQLKAQLVKTAQDLWTTALARPTKEAIEALDAVEELLTSLK
jgi:hypothetical protein